MQIFLLTSSYRLPLSINFQGLAGYVAREYANFYIKSFKFFKYNCAKAYVLIDPQLNADGD